MSRRVSLPERALSSEDAGLEPVDNSGRTKSGSVSSDDGEPYNPKQGRFFKSLTRSLDPAATAAPKKKNIMEEYQKYKAKRAFNLHGVVKQQTIDLGTLGISGSDKTAPSRRFSTGTNPPPPSQTSEPGAKSATLPVNKGSRGPPPPVAPRKKSVNLPLIPEPNSTQKIPSPKHETPSYILSAVKKEQQKAVMERQRAFSDTSVYQDTSTKNEETQANNLPCSEGKPPAELELKGEETHVGSNVSESEVAQEANSETASQGDLPAREDEPLSPIPESADAEKEAFDEQIATNKEMERKEEEKTEQGGSISGQNEGSDGGQGASVPEEKENQAEEAPSDQKSEPVIDAANEVEQNVIDEKSDSVQVEPEKEAAILTEVVCNEEVPADDTKSPPESTEVPPNEPVKEPTDSSTEPEGRPEVPQVIIEQSAAETKEESIDSKEVNGDNAGSMENKSDSPEAVQSDVGGSVEPVAEPAKQDVCQDSNSNAEKAVVVNGDDGDRTGVEKEGNDATDKLSKTADLLLSFSQEKDKPVDASDSDLAGIGEELKKLNSTIEELSQAKKTEETASSEDQEKLKEIEKMRQEMESMRQEMELFG